MSSTAFTAPARPAPSPARDLGLAIVRQAAEAHGGSASASNAAGGGALLRVSFGPVLPIVDEETPSDPLEV